MKNCEFLILYLCLLHSLAQEKLDSDLSQDTEEQEYKQFQSWKDQFNIFFDSNDEEQYRFKIFEQTNRKIKDHNSRKDVTYQMRLNQFSDLSDEEFSAIYLINLSGYILEDQVNHVSADERKESKSDFILHKHHEKNKYENKNSETEFLQGNIPASLDLTQISSAWNIRDQGQCGSCWTFSSCAAMEYAYYRRTGYLGDLAEQQLVDCVYGSAGGCQGGWMPTAFEYVAKNGGIAWEQDYPYKGQNGNCRASSIRSKSVWLSQNQPYVKVASDDLSIKTALNNNGVLAVCVDAGGWGSYGGGMYQLSKGYSLSCSHAVVLVGYGTENGIPYWKIRNSWNTWWGEKGYMRLDARRDSNGKSLGGIMLEYAYYPVIY